MKLAQTNLSKLAETRPAVAKRLDCGVFSAAFPRLPASRRAPSGDQSPQSKRSAPFVAANVFVAQTIFSKLKACNHSAQRCAERATLGYRAQILSTLKGLHQFSRVCLAPLRGAENIGDFYPGYRSAQPWAECLQPFRLLKPVRVTGAAGVDYN